MSGVVVRRYAAPLPRGGAGVHVDPSLIDGFHGILLVPTFENYAPEELGSIPFEAYYNGVVEVRSYRATRYPVEGFREVLDNPPPVFQPPFWRPTQQLQHTSTSADRYALSLIAGTGRNRA